MQEWAQEFLTDGLLETVLFALAAVILYLLIVGYQFVKAKLR